MFRAGQPVKLLGAWEGPDVGEARRRYHQHVIDTYGDDPATRQTLVRRLETQITERQLLLAAIKRWERAEL